MALLEQLNKLTAQNIFLDENTGGKGRYFKSRFLQAGLVKYSFGVCILSKETIDKFVDGFVGCPVIINHKDVTNESAKDDRVGVISRVWYDEKDGWFWCEGVIFDEEAISLIESGYNVSCQYEITEYSNNTTKALHNGNPYDKVILNGKPEHLAIVKTPRYESAMIAVNALDLTAENEDKWITIHPNGEEGKGKHLLLKDGETPKEAIDRVYRKEDKKQSDTKDEKKERTFIDKKTGKEQSLKDLVEKGLTPVRYSSSLWENKPSYGIGDGKIEYKITEEEYKQALEHQKDKKSTDLKKNKEQSKDLTDYIKWQYNADIEPHITRRVGDKTLVEWDKLPRETQSALKRLDFDDKVNLEQYSSYEMSIDVKDKKIFKNLEKHRQHISEQKQSDTKDERIEARRKHQEVVKKHNQAYKDFEDGKISMEELDKADKELEKSNKEFYGKSDTAKNTIIEAINELKENDMFNKLFNKKEKAMELNKDEMKELFIDCIQDVLKAQNEAEKEEVKEEIEEEEKAENKKACNEDKRKLIDEVAGMMKSAGCDDEVIRTAIAKMEKIGYDKSEAGTADNCGKKGKNEDEEEKEEALNKAKNSIDALKGLLSQGEVRKPASKYITKSQAIELGNQLF